MNPAQTASENEHVPVEPKVTVAEKEQPHTTQSVEPKRVGTQSVQNGRVEGFGKQVAQPRSTNTRIASPHALPLSNFHALFIGPRGFMGPHVVRSLLLDPKVSKIYCLNSGRDGFKRLREVFEYHGFLADFDKLKLEFIPADLREERFGLSEEQWSQLRESVHVVVHNAWNTNILKEHGAWDRTFRSSLWQTMNFVRSSFLRPRLVFISCMSAFQNWSNEHPFSPVPERPFSDLEVLAPHGCAHLKHIAEAVLHSEAEIHGFAATTIRIGHVAGPTSGVNGTWPREYFLPGIALISRVIGMIPNDLSDIDWIPSNQVGRIISEICVSETLNREIHNPDDATAQVEYSPHTFNLVNPRTTPWTTFAHILHHRISAMSNTPPTLVPFTTWSAQVSRNPIPKPPRPAADTLNAVLDAALSAMARSTVNMPAAGPMSTALPPRSNPTSSMEPGENRLQGLMPDMSPEQAASADAAKREAKEAAVAIAARKARERYLEVFVWMGEMLRVGGSVWPREIETEQAKRVSGTMRNLGPVTDEMMKAWCEGWGL